MFYVVSSESLPWLSRRIRLLAWTHSLSAIWYSVPHRPGSRSPVSSLHRTLAATSVSAVWCQFCLSICSPRTFEPKPQIVEMLTFINFSQVLSGCLNRSAIYLRQVIVRAYYSCFDQCNSASPVNRLVDCLSDLRFSQVLISLLVGTPAAVPCSPGCLSSIQTLQILNHKRLLFRRVSCAR